MARGGRAAKKQAKPQEVQGVVKKVFTKNDRVSLAMDIGEEDDVWFGFGYDDPEVEEGDEVSFKYTVNGNFNNGIVDSIEVLESVPKKKKSSPPKSKGGSGSTKQDVDWDKKDRMISMHACRNTAMSMMELMVKTEAIKIPNKVADRKEFLMSTLTKLTDEMFLIHQDEENYPKLEDVMESQDMDDDSVGEYDD